MIVSDAGELAWGKVCYVKLLVSNAGMQMLRHKIEKLIGIEDVNREQVRMRIERMVAQCRRRACAYVNNIAFGRGGVET